MDTTWFAVDAEGYVGAFDTGERGVVPWRVPHVEQVFEYAQTLHSSEVLAFPEDFSDPHSVFDYFEFVYRQSLWAAPELVLANAIEADFETHLSRGDAIERDWRFAKERARQDREIWAQDKAEYGDRYPYPPPEESAGYEEHLMFLPSADLAEVHLATGRARVKSLPDLETLIETETCPWLLECVSDSRWKSAVAVYFQSIDFADAMSLHNAGCLYCVNCQGFDEDSELNLARLGMYQFFGDDEDADNGAYFRLVSHDFGSYRLPHEGAYPLHVDRLPDGLRTLIAAVQFDRVSFRNTPSFHVDEHQPCYEYRDPYGESFAYDPATSQLCCTSTRSEITQWVEKIWRRAELEAECWGYSFQGPTSPGSVAAKRRILRLWEHRIACERRQGEEIHDSWKATVKDLEEDIAYWESKSGQ
jgi:hypothetical protein